MKQSFKYFLGVLIIGFLTACGSAESNIEGNWKAVIDGEDVGAYMEIGEERIISRQESNDEPITLEYIVTETQDDNFILEVVNPENGTNEFFFEGHFENKNTIKIVNAPGNSAEEQGELVRIKSVQEEMKKDKEEEAAKEAEVKKKEKLAAKKSDEKKKAQKLAEEKEEMKLEQLAKEKEEEEAKALRDEKEAAGIENSWKIQADALDDKIMKDAKEVDPHAQDMQEGFYGQYYGEWDDLLNEVWVELKAALPNKEFEELKYDQNQWIEEKEQNFKAMPDQVASQRAKGMDYLTFETKDRVYYLIGNYMD
ncbi:lysozyme inhibitor LprI family protein [Virgibacillus sp. SK37]|uniref:lysozyme inhibitor LprI family protein n=1 Tax=Virgibacillus sp. SK37 TaxID=403957 RepID=UPI0004D1366D|nr:lysozyme inhibitor LprI family protein [Virgibacillus sp. SK37]AIF45550.1 hypothetical protein X953_16285 [Virgibacillus sp. SK37]